MKEYMIDPINPRKGKHKKPAWNKGIKTGPVRLVAKKQPARDEEIALARLLSQLGISKEF